MMKRVGILVCIVLLSLTSCGEQPSPAAEMALASTETPFLPTTTPVPPTATPTPTPIPPTTTPTPTLEPSPEPPFEGIVVTYNGRGCTVSSPTALSAGDHQLVVKNSTREYASLRIYRNLCGHTFQELVEMQGTPGSNFLPGTLLFHASQTENTIERNQSTGEFLYTYSFHTVGEYSVALGTSQNYWLCGALEVTEDSEPVRATPTPELVSCEGAEGTCLELTYDGKSCTYAGPTYFEQGPVTLLFINASEEYAAVNLLRHMDGKTIEDMLALFAAGVSKTHHPSWTEEIDTWRPINPGMNQVWRGELESGIHTMVCHSLCSELVWFGTGFTVGE